MAKRLYTLVLCMVGLVSQPTPALAQADAAKQATWIRDGQHDFDFEIGTWTTRLSRLRNPLSGSTAWIDYAGTTVVRKVLDGRANLAELSVDGPAGRIEGLSLRLYEPGTRRWTLNFANIADGLLTQPMAGAFHDGRGEFFADDTFNGRPIRVRFVIMALERDQYRFEQAFSEDGGKTWEVNWIATDTRRAEAAPSVVAPPRNARSFAQAFDQVQFHRDIKQLRSMVADEMVFISGSGRIEGKREFIDGFASPTLLFHPVTIVDPAYTQLGPDAAIAGGEVVLRGSENGKAFASHFRFADTFTWRNGRWQVVHVPVMPIPKRAK